MYRTPPSTQHGRPDTVDYTRLSVVSKNKMQTANATATKQQQEVEDGREGGRFDDDEKIERKSIMGSRLLCRTVARSSKCYAVHNKSAKESIITLQTNAW